MEALRRLIERHVRRSVNQLPTEATVREAAKALSSLDDVTAEPKILAKIVELKGLFSQMLESTSAQFTETTQKVAPLSGFVRQGLEAIADDRLGMASKVVDQYLGDVRSSVLDSVVLGKSAVPDDILDTVGEKAFSYIKTEMNTALMSYQRLVHLKKAEKAGITKFLYVGPDDDVTRPFCSELVDRVYSAEEIAAMDNGQGLPVEVYGGGYNCRHHWRPISDNLAEELAMEQDNPE